MMDHLVRIDPDDHAMEMAFAFEWNKIKSLATMHDLSSGQLFGENILIIGCFSRQGEEGEREREGG